MSLLQPLTPFLWFDREAEEAATFYTAIFPNSRITAVSRYTEVGQEIHGQAAGAVQTVAFELNGQPFTALNGGPIFRFTEAVSFQIICRDQAEVDHYWEHLGAGGDPEAQQCGWLKDRFGLSWQVVPQALYEVLGGSDPAGVQRATAAMLQMQKLEIVALRQAYEG